jgi:zinc protease
MDLSRNRLRFRVVLSLILLIGLTGAGLAARSQQAAPAATPPVSLDTRVPLDPAVRLGTLPNGLTFYIRHNKRPDDRVLLRLAVKAGSIDEQDDQRGLAHVLEHMAFNGSEHFKPGELVSKFEAIGSRLGPHLNAYTSFEETVYMLQVPTDQEGFTRLGLQALSDFAGRLSLEPKEIDKERGVVVEEWRGGLGAQSRIRDKQLPVLFHGSRYATRLPIGDPEIIKTFPPERLRAFYETWYRPDLMAVIVVGDIDVDAMEGLVRELFADLRKPSSPVPSRGYEAALGDELLASVATDPEVTQSSVSIARKHRRLPQATVADFRRTLVGWLVETMFNDRLDELSRKSDAAFLSARAQEESLSKTVEMFSLAARVEEVNIERGATALEIEARRVARHGFGAAELARAKAQLSAVYERAFAER